MINTAIHWNEAIQIQKENIKREERELEEYQ